MPQDSSAFQRLHPRLQRWVWEKGWTELRDAQERACEPILAGDKDVIISAATASGKTEAAFLSICSELLRARDDVASHGAGEHRTEAPARGVKVLYVSPLKALINDQYGRLDDLCENLDIPVHRWHGDVPASRKAKVIKDPSGILLITPESLEALMVVHGPHVGLIFAGLRYVVIDELHAFLGTERGAQLQSLLHRVELTIRRSVPRVGLSATLGNMSLAAEFLRPSAGHAVTVIVSEDGGQELKIQLRGYEAKAVRQRKDEVDSDDADTDETPADQLTIAGDLFRVMRGSDNLVFANSRRNVELYTDLLGRRCETEHVPNEFVPHHGSLSKELREYTEARLKNREMPVTAICTSTLELGIDIGSVTSIAQLSAPHTVSSLRQRLGRSGRRGGPAILRLYITEQEITPQTTPEDALRTDLVQAIAMVNLLLDGWNETPDAGGLHLSTLIQQLLSMIAQYGGVSPSDAYQALCGHGPFSGVDPSTFAKLLRALGAPDKDIISQASDGLLLLGLKGERIVNHYSFYAAFSSPQEYRLVAAGRTLGMLPIDYPLIVGSLLIFGGRRWKVVDIDDHAKVVELIRSRGGLPPTFAGDGGRVVSDQVREEMLRVYLCQDIPAYLDAPARRLLSEGRDYFRRFHLDTSPLLVSGSDTLLFPWAGDRALSTLATILTSGQLEVSHDGVALALPSVGPGEALELLTRLLSAEPVDAVELAAKVPAKAAEKHDWMLSDELLAMAFASRSLDVPGAYAAALRVVSDSRA